MGHNRWHRQGRTVGEKTRAEWQDAAIKAEALLIEAHDVLHNVAGMISDRDEAHSKITDLMRRIREQTPVE